MGTDHHTGHSHHHHKPNKGLIIALPITMIFAFVELYSGKIGEATVLIADAWHMFTDVISMLIVIIVPWMLIKANIHSKKAEAMAALLCGLLLILPCIEIVERILAKLSLHNPPNSQILTVIAVLGLLVNLASIKLVHWGENGHAIRLSSRAVRLHILGDLMGSMVAILVGIIALASNKDVWADIIGSMIILAILIFGLARLLYHSVIDLFSNTADGT